MEKDLVSKNKREFLSTLGSVAIGAMSIQALSALPAMAIPENGKFQIGVMNLHTGEAYKGIYREGNRYNRHAFREINNVLRDHRTGDVFPMDPRLIDTIAAIHRQIGSDAPFEIISGYRSPKTNKMLHNATTGVAPRSLHMSGKAMDVRLPDASSRLIQKIAIDMGAGGVGYYQKSNFVHIDTGRVRAW